MSTRSVKIVRLTTGEELICAEEVAHHGDVNNETAHHVLSEIGIIIPTGEGNVGIAPFLPYAAKDPTLVIPSTHIMFITNPAPELISVYNRAFGKIEVIQPQIQIPH
jgi:hypothetical protein